VRSTTLHDPRMLLISYRVLQCLVGLIAVLARGEVSKDAELLALPHENTVLRRRLPRVRSHPPTGCGCRLSPAAPPLPLEPDLPGHPGHHPDLAPQTPGSARKSPKRSWHWVSTWAMFPPKRLWPTPYSMPYGVLSGWRDGVLDRCVTVWTSMGSWTSGHRYTKGTGSRWRSSATVCGCITGFR
jgi:hypothetical protein